MITDAFDIGIKLAMGDAMLREAARRTEPVAKKVVRKAVKSRAKKTVSRAVGEAAGLSTAAKAGLAGLGVLGLGGVYATTRP